MSALSDCDPSNPRSPSASTPQKHSSSWLGLPSHYDYTRRHTTSLPPCQDRFDCIDLLMDTSPHLHHHCIFTHPLPPPPTPLLVLAQGTARRLRALSLDDPTSAPTPLCSRAVRFTRHRRLGPGSLTCGHLGPPPRREAETATTPTSTIGLWTPRCFDIDTTPTQDPRPA